MSSALVVLEPPAIEPVSIGLLKQHLRLDTDDDDELLPVYLSSARSWVEAMLGRALITQTLQWTFARRRGFGSYGPTPFLPLVFPGGGATGMACDVHRPIELPRSPVQLVTSVTAVSHDGTPMVLDPSQYRVDTTLQPARLRLLPGAVDDPVEHVQVVFTAGYGEAAVRIPVPIIHAVLLLAAFVYENRGDAGGDMPPAAAALLAPYRIITFGG